MIVLNEKDVRDLLTMPACIKLMEKVLTDYAIGEAVQHLRSVVPIKNNNLMGIMPGYLKSNGTIGTKIITVYPENHTKGMVSHQGVVLLFDTENGRPKAIMDATAITAIRTAAASGVATDLLARPDAKVLSLIGSGEQARMHLEAILQIRPIQQVNVWSRHIENAERFKNDLEQKFSVPIHVCRTAKEAVQNADIICTLTAATAPILKGKWVKAGTHVNAVGACRAGDRELDSALVQKSLFFVDSRESATKESGDYLIPLEEGIINSGHIVGEIGDILTRKIEGRKSDEAITIFESLGLAIEDLASAHFLYEEAHALKRGTHIRM